VSSPKQKALILHDHMKSFVPFFHIFINQSLDTKFQEILVRVGIQKLKTVSRTCIWKTKGKETRGKDTASSKKSINKMIINFACP